MIKGLFRPVLRNARGPRFSSRRLVPSLATVVLHEVPGISFPQAQNHQEFVKEHDGSLLVQKNYHPQLHYKQEAGSINQPSMQDVIRIVVPHAKGAMDEEMVIVPVLGGLTNKLYKVTFMGADAAEQARARPAVLVRIFGSDSMIDRDLENVTYQALAESGIGPGYYGRFGNGRIEAFLEGCSTSTLEYVRDPAVSVRIAEAMARLHAIKLPKMLQPYYSEPQLWTQIELNLDLARENMRAGKLRRWGDAVQERFAREFDDVVGGVNFTRAQHAVQDLKRKTSREAPITFCHNDLHNGNVLFHEESGDIQIIDFEYSACNFRGYDIANHWNEYAGGNVDGRHDYDMFPGESQQREFCRAYLQESRRLEGREGDVSDASVAAMVEEARWFVHINRWYWGLWGINKAVSEGIEEFDYLLHAYERLSQTYER